MEPLRESRAVESLRESDGLRSHCMKAMGCGAIAGHWGVDVEPLQLDVVIA